MLILELQATAKTIPRRHKQYKVTQINFLIFINITNPCVNSTKLIIIKAVSPRVSESSAIPFPPIPPIPNTKNINRNVPCTIPKIKKQTMLVIL